MRLKDKQTLRLNTLQEFKKMLEKARNELFLLKIDKAQNKLKNTRSLFLKRKEIALILTLIREKELVEKSL